MDRPWPRIGRAGFEQGVRVDWQVLAHFISRYRGHLAMVAVVSVMVNLLVFAGSIYMMLVYDTVLPSRSLPTLIALFALLTTVYLFQAVFEAIRAEVLLRLAGAVHDDLFDAVHAAMVGQVPQPGADHDDGLQGLRDLDAIHGFLAGAGPIALIDLPWVVLFMAVLLVLHPWLGLTAIGGALVMGALALWSNRLTIGGSRELARLTGRRAGAALGEIRFAEAARAMGMADRLTARTRNWETASIDAQAALGRMLARLGGASRTVRLLLQSLILTVGAVLVINGQASGGVILASSVLSGRALAPVDQAIAQWRALAAARSGWARLIGAITALPRPAPHLVELAPPRAMLTVSDLWVSPPGSDRLVVQGASLALSAGHVLALIGPSAAGKSSLARALLGLWPVRRGEVRLDGATPDQWDQAVLGRHLGYVPQTVDLIDGTIGENIARFDPQASSGAIIAAARAAGMHEAIVALPDGYDTRVSAGGGELSGGQRQRIGLARALYGDPFLIVLDEANANLDAGGDAALAHAIQAARRRGAIVVMITHRPATLAPATHVAVMQHGRITDFGERDAVLARMGVAEPLRPFTSAPTGRAA